MRYLIDVAFSSIVQRSPRVMECTEAFGLGLKEQVFSIYKNLKVDVNQGDIVYITGQSGSGKSLLLRELARQMTEQGLRVKRIEEVELQDAPLIDQVGESTDDAIRILSLAGLNDAYLFIRSPSQLSDGQLYRFRIAKLMESPAQVWVADEFGAVLDRTTAKVVAFNLQKAARKVGATVIVATTHKDLKAELGPDLYIDKLYHDRVTIEKANHE